MGAEGPREKMQPWPRPGVHEMEMEVEMKTDPSREAGKMDQTDVEEINRGAEQTDRISPLRTTYSRKKN